MRYLSENQIEALLMLIACNPEIGVGLSVEEESILMKEPEEKWPQGLRDLLGPWKPASMA